ncbi:MAG: hypothetical protein QW841_01665 [Candidatus Aenigmatarchaeota archaeon]
MGKGDISLTAIIFIVCGIAVFIFAAAWVFKVPGLFGQLLGYIQTGLIAVGSTILDFLMKIFGKYFSAFATALGVTLNVILPTLTLQAVWPALSSALSRGWHILTQTHFYVGKTFFQSNFLGRWKLRLTTLWKYFKSGISRQAIISGIKNLIKVSSTMFFVSLGAELILTHLGVPQWIDSLNLPGQGFTVGGFSWSWGSAITAAGSTALGLGVVAALNWWNPVGWAAGLMIAGSFIIGGFIH